MSDQSALAVAVEARAMPRRALAGCLLAALALALAIGLPWLGVSSRGLTVATQVAVNAVFAASFHLIFGLTGMLWFAQAVFFGIGGYAVAYLLKGFMAGVLYFPVALLPVAGGVLAGVAGAGIGWIATRREKLAFAMISLAVTELVVGLGYVLRSISGGEEGISFDRWVGPEPFGITFGPQREVYLLSVVWLVASVALVAFIERTALGRLAIAVRENAERLSFAGYDVRRVRWKLFTLSSAMAGVAGSLFALNYEHVGLSLLGMEQSALALFSVVLGGLGSLTGALAGATAITLLSTFLADLTTAWLFYMGLIFTLLILFARSGLSGAVQSHLPFLRAGPAALAPLAMPYLRAIGAVLCCACAAIACTEVGFATNSGSRSAALSLGMPPSLAIAFWALILGGAFIAAHAACRNASQHYRAALRQAGLSAGPGGKDG